ncbi:MAG TPA: NAD(+) diphosphatase [Actinomycetota bacterium]|nr:NAD(+) diphosphatase [Actinomycetota bacterium]
MWPTAEPDLFVRDDESRNDPQLLLEMWNNPDRRLIAVYKGHVDVHPAGRFHVNDSLVLGTVDGVPWFAVRTRTDNTQELRAVADDLDALERSAALTAVALDNWHRAHTHCPLCGSTTEAARGGWVRRCLADGSEHFPRTDPAVIVLVVDDQQRALLGRRSIWPEGWYSTLAGFVEPGETFEQAVVREVLEEADVQVPVDRVEYRATQPWPFPCSIMIAFTAHTHAQTSVPDGQEIAETIWVSREEFQEAALAGRLRIPPRISVAHRLIADWFGEPIPHIWSR